VAHGLYPLRFNQLDLYSPLVITITFSDFDGLSTSPYK
jgi:hypothetical protein